MVVASRILSGIQNLQTCIHSYSKKLNDKIDQTHLFCTSLCCLLPCLLLAHFIQQVQTNTPDNTGKQQLAAIAVWTMIRAIATISLSVVIRLPFVRCPLRPGRKTALRCTPTVLCEHTHFVPLKQLSYPWVSTVQRV